MSGEGVDLEGWPVNDYFFIIFLAGYIATFPVFVGNERVAWHYCFEVCIACVFPARVVLLVHFKFE